MFGAAGTGLQETPLTFGVETTNGNGEQFYALRLHYSLYILVG